MKILNSCIFWCVNVTLPPTGCLQFRDSDDVQSPDGGQEVKSRMDEMEESPYSASLDDVKLLYP